MALHNVTEENLMKAIRAGGMPVPSIAMTTPETPFESFGDITLIGTHRFVDPKVGRLTSTSSVGEVHAQDASYAVYNPYQTGMDRRLGEDIPV